MGNNWVLEWERERHWDEAEGGRVDARRNPATSDSSLSAQCVLGGARRQVPPLRAPPFAPRPSGEVLPAHARQRRRQREPRAIRPRSVRRLQLAMNIEDTNGAPYNAPPDGQLSAEGRPRWAAPLPGPTRAGRASPLGPAVTIPAPSPPPAKARSTSSLSRRTKAPHSNRSARRSP